MIICGFSAIGKSHVSVINRGCVDLESSDYHWRNGELNPDFPQNYIDAALMLERQYKYVFLSCHQEVRDELHKRGVPFVIVAPYYALQNDYRKRWLRRGDDAKFIAKMDTSWRDKMMSVEKDAAPIVWLEKGEYLSDVIG